LFINFCKKIQARVSKSIKIPFNGARVVIVSLKANNMPVLPKMGSSFSPENSRIWFSHHQTLEVYFAQFEFLEWFSDKPTIFSTLEGEKIVMHFL
jgi:hypothetical protein